MPDTTQKECEMLTSMSKRIHEYSVVGGHALYRNRKLIKLLLLAVIMIAGFTSQAAQTGLKEGMGKIVGMVMIFGYPAVVVMGFVAAYQWSKGAIRFLHSYAAS